MSRKELLLPQEHLAPFDLEAFMNEAATLNQRTGGLHPPLSEGPRPLALALPIPAAPDRLHARGGGRGGTQLADRRDD